MLRLSISARPGRLLNRAKSRKTGKAIIRERINCARPLNWNGCCCFTRHRAPSNWLRVVQIKTSYGERPASTYYHQLGGSIKLVCSSSYIPSNPIPKKGRSFSYHWLKQKVNIIPSWFPRGSWREGFIVAVFGLKVIICWVRAIFSFFLTVLGSA